MNLSRMRSTLVVGLMIAVAALLGGCANEVAPVTNTAAATQLPAPPGAAQPGDTTGTAANTATADARATTSPGATPSGTLPKGRGSREPSGKVKETVITVDENGKTTVTTTGTGN